MDFNYQKNLDLRVINIIRVIDNSLVTLPKIKQLRHSLI